MWDDIRLSALTYCKKKKKNQWYQELFSCVHTAHFWLFFGFLMAFLKNGLIRNGKVIKPAACAKEPSGCQGNYKSILLATTKQHLLTPVFFLSPKQAFSAPSWFEGAHLIAWPCSFLIGVGEGIPVSFCSLAPSAIALHFHAVVNLRSKCRFANANIAHWHSCSIQEINWHSVSIIFLICITV